jgi:hypothetical protein
MNQAISRTTVKDGNKYKVYQKSAPLFYKDENGDLKDIELTWTKDGNKYISNKNICSTEIDTTTKNVKIKADGGKDILIDFTISKVSFDGNDIDLDLTELSCVDNKVDTKDVLFMLKNSRVMQLFKTPDKFKDFRIEYTISLNNCSIINKLNTDTYQLTNNDTFEIIDLGEKTGNWIFESNGTDALENDFVSNKDNAHIDFYVSKITDEFILQSSQYTEDEEFNSSLSNYNSCKIGWEGSSMYLKDTIICYFKSQNIDNAEDVIISNICSMYDLTTIFEDDVNGRYFIDSNNKKVGSFSYDNEGRFFVFFNTKNIPSNIKDMFKRKTFNDVSYIDKTLDNFKSDINNMFSYKYNPILEDTNYYIGHKLGEYVIQVANTPFLIKKPSLFDKDLNIIGICSHSMKKNDDNTFTYTKYFRDNMSRKDNSNIKYIDVDLQLDEELISMYDRYTVPGNILPGNSKTTTNFDGARETETSAEGLPDDHYISGSYLTTIVKYLIKDNCTKTKQTSSGYGVTTTTWSSVWDIGCSLHHFDTSSITDTVTDASFKFYGKYENLSTGTVTGDAIDLRPLTMIALKSSSVQNSAEGQNNTNNTYTTNDWNSFDGWTSNWDSSDVTEYGTSCDMKQGTNNVANDMEYDTFNSAFYTDVQNTNDVYIYFMDKDLMYDDDYAITQGLGQDNSTSSSGKRNVYCYGNDVTNTDHRPYLEVTTGTVATPTENATFFGANF